MCLAAIHLYAKLLTVFTLTVASDPGFVENDRQTTEFSSKTRIILHGRSHSLRHFLIGQLMHHSLSPSLVQPEKGVQTTTFELNFSHTELSVINTPDFQSSNRVEFLIQLDRAASIAELGVARVYFIIGKNESESKVAANMKALTILYGSSMAGRIKFVIESDRKANPSRLVQITPYKHSLSFVKERNGAYYFLKDVFKSKRDTLLHPEGNSVYKTLQEKQALIEEMDTKRKKIQSEEQEQERQRQHNNLMRIVLSILSLILFLTIAVSVHWLKSREIPIRTKSSLIVIMSIFATGSIISLAASFLYQFTGFKELKNMLVKQLQNAIEFEHAIQLEQTELREYLQLFE